MLASLAVFDFKMIFDKYYFIPSVYNLFFQKCFQKWLITLFRKYSSDKNTGIVVYFSIIVIIAFTTDVRSL